MTSKKIRPSIFDILLLSSFFLIVVFLLYVLTRSSKELTVTLKVGQDDIKEFSWERGISDSFFPSYLINLKDRNYFGKSTAKIIGIKEYDTDPGKKNVYVTVLLQTIYNPALKRYTYNGNNVLIGSTIQINFENLLVSGLITNINNITTPRPVKLIVTADIINSQINSNYKETTGVFPFIADNLNEGDSIVDLQKKPFLKLVSKTVRNAKRTTTSSDGSVFLKEDPYLKDVSLTFEINGTKIDNHYYLWEDIPILINYPLPVHFDIVSIWPLVTSIRELK